MALAGRLSTRAAQCLVYAGEALFLGPLSIVSAELALSVLSSARSIGNAVGLCWPQPHRRYRQLSSAFAELEVLAG
jgi:hypothetical protein